MAFFSSFFLSPWVTLKKRKKIWGRKKNWGKTIFADVDGGLSGGSSVRRPGSEEPHLRQRKFEIIITQESTHYGLVWPSATTVDLMEQLVFAS